MKIRAAVMAAGLAMLAGTGAFGFGIGLEANLEASSGLATGLAAAISPSRKANFTVAWRGIGEERFSLGVTADAAPLRLPLFAAGNAGTFYFTLGGGLFGKFTFGADEVDLAAGFRIPVGFSLGLGEDTMEAYCYGAPSFPLRFVPQIEVYNFFVAIGVGFRFWLE